MLAQGADDTIKRYQDLVTEYQSKMATTGYSFYQDSIDTYQKNVDDETAKQQKNYDMAKQEKADYQKLIGTCRTELGTK